MKCQYYCGFLITVAIWYCFGCILKNIPIFINYKEKRIVTTYLLFDLLSAWINVLNYFIHKN